MIVRINGKEYAFEEEVPFLSVLEKFKIKKEAVAVELNRKILPKSRYNETIIKDGDKIEIVTFVGGG